MVHYYPQLPEGPSHLSRSQLSRLNPQSVYKRLVITLRSLYTYLRVLPAHRMARACKVRGGPPGGWRRGGSGGVWCNSGARHSRRRQLAEAHLPARVLLLPTSAPHSSRVLKAWCVHCLPSLQRQRGASFSLGYRLHSTLPGSSAAAAPGARRLQSFRFGPVDTPYGQLRIGVDYQPASTVTILEQTTSPPALPQIIADYVGGGGEGASRAGARAAAGSGATALTRPLRHAVSTSAVGPAAAPRASPPAAPGLLEAQQPGTSPQQAAGRARGTLPIRRSWSTSLRGVSPQRALSQPPSELPSPTTAAQDTPYGSAPQAVSGGGVPK